MSMIENDNLQEFVDSDGGMIGGDRNVTNDSEIETGPVKKPWNDDSEYEKGMSTTTDRATRYRQNIPWFAVYSYRSSSGRGLPINEKTQGSLTLTKKQVEEDLVKKSKKDGDMFDKNYNSKIEKIVDTINDTELSKEQLERLKKAVLDKINEKDA